MADVKVMEQPAKVAVRRVDGKRIKLAETSRNVWRVVAPAEDDPEDCLMPGYLWHRHDRIRPGDLIEITGERYNFFLQLLVARIDMDTQSIQTRIIHACDFSDQPLEAPNLADAIVENKGGSWRVKLGTGILSTGHATRGEAEDWLSQRKIQIGAK